MNYWERWSTGEKVVVVLFGAGLLAFVLATAIRSIPSRPAEIKIYDVPQPSIASERPVAAPAQSTVPTVPTTATSQPAQSTSPPTIAPSGPSSVTTTQPPSAAAGTPSKPSKTQDAITGPISINTADAAQLDRLPGIGPVLAQRIVEYRQKLGRFTSVEQLLEVRGVGPKKLEKIRPLVTL